MVMLIQNCLKINFIQSQMVQNIMLSPIDHPTPTYPSYKENHMRNSIQSRKQIKHPWDPVSYCSNLNRRAIYILFRESFVSLPLARCYGDDKWWQSTGNTQPPWMGLSQPDVLIASITGLILQARPDNKCQMAFLHQICSPRESSVNL